MIPANPKIYDYAKFFDDYGYVDWKQRLKFEVGDIVYLYCSKPFQKVMYKTEVIKESMPFSECTEDEDYWTNPEDYETSNRICVHGSNYLDEQIWKSYLLNILRIMD